MDVKIEASWTEALEDEFKKPYFKQIRDHLKTERAQGKTIYPPGSQIFNAFEKTPFNNVKVVILGQDPYHGPGQAMGLSFSVPYGVSPPPSRIPSTTRPTQSTTTSIARLAATRMPQRPTKSPFA